MIWLDRIILVAAPSCCGKTMFINMMRRDKLQRISADLQMGDVSSWTYKDAFYINARSLKTIEKSPINKIVLHWTIPHPTFKLALRNLVLLCAYDKTSRLQIMKSSREITVLTLYTSQSSLLRRVEFRRQRILERRLEGKESLFSLTTKKRRTRKLAQFYSDMCNLAPLYERWFHFCETLNPGASYLVNVEDEPSLVSITKWSEIKEGWGCGTSSK